VPLTPEERRLRGLLYLNAVIAIAFVALYLAGGIADGEQFRFVVNSVAKDGLFALLSLLAAADVRRRGWLALVIAFGYTCLVLAELVMLVVGGQADVTSFGVTIGAVPYLAGWIVSDAVLTAWLLAWWWQAEQARHGLRYLNPLAFTSLRALAEVLIDGQAEAVGAGRVARNVDGYLADLDAAGKQRIQLALSALAVFPLLTLRLPFAAMAPDARLRYLERRFIDDVVERRLLRPLRPYVQAMIRVASQMTYLGYYGDRASWTSVGYEPFSEREGGRLPAEGDRPGRPLLSLAAVPAEEFDAIVIGSGAGGAIVANRLARTQRVLVLERGPHVDPGEFTEDEVGQYLRLYNEGALQLATDFRLQVLQGMCVGGGTTINNAVCFDPPDAVLERWHERGLDGDHVRAAVREVRDWLQVARIAPRVTSEGAGRFAAGAQALALPGTIELVEANIAPDCLGCGYCNMGCPFGKKRSMLDTVLPWAQRDHGDNLQVLPGFHAERVVHEGGRALGVAGRHEGGEPVELRAKRIVVSAGAVGSSWLLQRSGIAPGRAGRSLFFNVNSPLTADFPDPVRTYAGLQMSHAYLPEGPGREQPYVLETWFNPPATQALAMPGWFSRHYDNMRRYAHMVCGGVLVGTTTPAQVAAGGSEPEIVYTPSREDLARVVAGLKLMGRMFLAAGAQRVLPATYAWHEMRSEAELDRLDAYVRDNADLLLTTAHPQGGNPIGPASEGGVVGPDFRVHDFENLWVADASVFPSSVGVNPQLTVMALARHAADQIAA
jgi:choline dehydrogenase-like flavoprotein